MAMGKAGYGQDTGQARRFMSDDGSPTYPMSGISYMGGKSKIKKYPETKGRKYSKGKRMKVGSY